MPKSVSLTWPCLGDDEVGRLDVAVPDALRVRDGQRLEQLVHHRQHVGLGQHLRHGQDVVQRAAVDELHRDEGDVAVLAEVVDRDHARMRDAADGLGLVAEARGHRVDRGGVAQQLAVDRLDRHRRGGCAGRTPCRPCPWSRGRAPRRSCTCRCVRGSGAVVAMVTRSEGGQPSSIFIACARLVRMRLNDSDSTPISSLDLTANSGASNSPSDTRSAMPDSVLTGRMTRR